MKVKAEGLSLGLLTIILLSLSGCMKIDTTPPDPPSGLRSITGDRAVYLYWNPNTEPDLAGYRVYRNNAPSGYFKLIADVKEPYYVDRDVENGITYYYAVSAYDTAGNESELSEEDCFDTPRPEGYNMKIYEKDYLPSFAGYSFGNYSPVPFNSLSCDFYFDVVSGRPFLIAVNGTLVQDMGAYEMDDIDYAPLEGWDSDGAVEAIQGHVYVFWTVDNHFAKIRITALGSNYLVFDWAYQVAEGNRELVLRPVFGNNREVQHD
ncbi:MAG: hypothetical protein ACPLN0_03850 [Candidatus Hydrothermia bacterium]